MGTWRFELSLEHIVNDGLMALFFFLVGMEIKHELSDGELASRERAALPVARRARRDDRARVDLRVAAARGGARGIGWGIPMATDIAFAVAALAVLGSRVPSGLKVFLLALAIADDLAAVTVIAVFYTHEISLPALAAAAAGLGFVVAMRRAGVRRYALYARRGHRDLERHARERRPRDRRGRTPRRPDARAAARSRIATGRRSRSSRWRCIRGWPSW